MQEQKKPFVSKLKGTEGQAPLQSSEKTERHRNQILGNQYIMFITYEKEKEKEEEEARLFGRMWL